MSTVKTLPILDENEQLNPEWLGGRPGQEAFSASDALAQSLPVRAYHKLTAATMTGILSVYYDFMVNEHGLTHRAASESVKTIATRMVNLHKGKIPAAAEVRVTEMLAGKLRMRHPRLELQEKVLEEVADDLVGIDDPGAKIEEVLSNDAATKEEVDNIITDPDSDDVVIESELPETIDASLRHYSVGRRNSKIAAALMTRKLLSIETSKTLKLMKNHLPEDFMKRYQAPGS